MLDVLPHLPVDPSDEELARDWTLSAADLEEVRKSRGAEHRQRFAVQLCALRAIGGSSGMLPRFLFASRITSGGSWGYRRRCSSTSLHVPPR